MMRYVCGDGSAAGNPNWRSLFDLVIVSARTLAPSLSPQRAVCETYARGRGLFLSLSLSLRPRPSSGALLFVGKGRAAPPPRAGKPIFFTPEYLPCYELDPGSEPGEGSDGQREPLWREVNRLSPTRGPP